MAAADGDVSYFLLSLVEPDDAPHLVILREGSISLPAKVSFAADPDLASQVEHHRESVASSDLKGRIFGAEWYHLNIRILTLLRIKLPSWNTKLSPFRTATCQDKAIIIYHNRMSSTARHFDNLLILESFTGLRDGIVPYQCFFAKLMLFNFFKQSTIGVVSPSV